MNRPTILVLSYKGYTGSVPYMGKGAPLIGYLDNVQGNYRFQGRGAIELLDSFHAVVDQYISECAGAVISEE